MYVGTYVQKIFFWPTAIELKTNEIIKTNNVLFIKKKFHKRKKILLYAKYESYCWKSVHFIHHFIKYFVDRWMSFFFFNDWIDYCIKIHILDQKYLSQFLFSWIFLNFFFQATLNLIMDNIYSTDFLIHYLYPYIVVVLHLFIKFSTTINLLNT